ncbi:peroxiredoxin-like family protein [Peloplasma aerotolerans]|uniref:thioredoxin-dependent peroxiredoxin n=1 Tax=Peloplasma aerotolerans TaxID=3044389 RepID=A0AAW6U500_9MOLU|nr:peroxiredoxin-like family protein [Mariniplasma sp. M4Ah]MDI6453053.1 peroxiredoxin-like family protein [Mariniplasma sp. M4Ah]
MKSLNDKIEQLKNISNKKLDPEKEKLFLQAIKELEMSEQAKGIKVGDKAKDFILPDQNQKQVRLFDLLKNGPIVLTFYRGGWCPYCNLQLRAYQEILDKIHELGASLVAVSPQKPDRHTYKSLIDGLTFTVLSDENNEVSKLYHVLYELPEYLVKPYQELGINLELENINRKWILPSPATYIIDRTGLIVHANIHSDFKKRMEPEHILSILEILN